MLLASLRRRLPLCHFALLFNIFCRQKYTIKYQYLRRHHATNFWKSQNFEFQNFENFFKFFWAPFWGLSGALAHPFLYSQRDAGSYSDSRRFDHLSCFLLNGNCAPDDRVQSPWWDIPPVLLLSTFTVQILYKLYICNWTVLTVITQKLPLHVQLHYSTAHLL